DKLLPYIMEEGYGAPDSAREIRIAAARLLKNADLSPACFTCAFTLLKDRLIHDDLEGTRAALRWFAGEKLERFERKDSGLYETLQKATARRWLDSILKLIVLSGQQGLVVLIDDLDVLYERSPETGRFLYTPANIKDTYELFRQLIDDADLLKNFLLILAGRRDMLDDDRRGFKSYEALWMRLQTGLVPSGRFNPLCDIVDVDEHLNALGEDFPAVLSRHLNEVFNQYGLKKKPRDKAIALMPSPALKSVVMSTVYVGDEDPAGGDT
ncbi:MAG: BREX system ATP-binding domain-containing protein, partial [Bacillota bacterium]|nr:BREX system ATP-binding domain-containing protein [Bacillota bacterium]